MTIQFNSDKSLTVHAEYEANLSGILTDELSRFSEYITRLEVHLSDENGSKEGQNDKRCLLEARLKGRNPIAVKDEANTFDLAVSGATEKLKSSLDKITGRLKDH
jgi:ribosome-associated translation inhibitor RaiA